MSGGSWDYVYCKVDEAADRLCNEKQAERRALGRHLKAVATAMHDIEWVDSCDMGRGDDIEAIRAALGQNAPALILAEVVIEAEETLAQLGIAIREAKEAHNARGN